MCLIVKKNTKKKIAEKDVVCYKLVERCSYDKTTFRTPFRNVILSDSILKGKETYKASGRMMPFHPDYIELERGDRIIEKGGIHTYANKKDVMKEVDKTNNSNFHIYKCIIPKGTPYYEGYFYCLTGDYVSYASKQIKFVKQVV